MTGIVIAILLLAAAGAGLVVAAVWLLAGTGWALLVGGCLLLAAAGVLRRGLKPNG